MPGLRYRLAQGDGQVRAHMPLAPLDWPTRLGICAIMTQSGPNLDCNRPVAGATCSGRRKSRAELHVYTRYMTTTRRTPAEILIIDDDFVMRELLELHLSDEGYKVRTAEDAIDGGKMMIAAPPDLLVLDMHMPHMEGDRFLKLLRADERFRNLKVIVLTAEQSLDFMMKVTELGVSDFLNKPIDKDLLLEAVKKVLAT